jgi:hypothetical protein
MGVKFLASQSHPVVRPRACPRIKVWSPKIKRKLTWWRECARRDERLLRFKLRLTRCETIGGRTLKLSGATPASHTIHDRLLKPMKIGFEGVTAMLRKFLNKSRRGCGGGTSTAFAHFEGKFGEALLMCRN